MRARARTLATPGDDPTPLAAWAPRPPRAHANATENMVLFAPAALAVHVAARGDALTAGACAVYFFARLAHYLVYTLGIPLARTLAWAAGWGATLVLIARLLGWL